jgi:hypothetical protein
MDTVEKQYEDYFDLFSRPGWKLLMEDLQDMIIGLDSIDYVKDHDDLLEKKGQLRVLRRLQGFQNAIEQAHQEYINAKTL